MTPKARASFFGSRIIAPNVEEERIKYQIASAQGWFARVKCLDGSILHDPILYFMHGSDSSAWIALKDGANGVIYLPTTEVEELVHESQFTHPVLPTTKKVQP